MANVVSNGNALDPQGMIVFAALAREGGVRGAAAALGVPRSTVSRRLAQLERSLGAPLVVRTARRFALTELGAQFAERCRALEELLRGSEELARNASSEPSGLLRAAVSPVFAEEVLPAVASELLRRYPRLRVDLRVSVEYVDLRGGEVDVAVRTGPVEDATDLFAVRVGTSTKATYASRAYLDARGVPEVPSDLVTHDCIVIGSSPVPAWTFKSGERVSLPVRARVDNYHAARALAACGAGVVRLGRLFGDPWVAEGRLVPVLERHWQTVPIFAVHAGANPPPPKVKAFIELVREAARRKLA